LHIDIQVGSKQDLVLYGQIPCVFTVDRRVDVSLLEDTRGAVVESYPVVKWEKDYDLDSREAPNSLASQFDVRLWKILRATEDTQPAGGAIVAVQSDGFNFSGLDEGSAVLVDIRVDPAYRRFKVGTTLLDHSIRVCREMGKRTLLVENQDVNLPACRMYSNFGFRLAGCERTGYGPAISEAKLVWKYLL
jgi:ribosomal protein S18 acetylase RimI-like enzyme